MRYDVYERTLFQFCEGHPINCVPPDQRRRVTTGTCEAAAHGATVSAK